MLKSRDDHVAHVLDDAKTQLAKIAHDRSKYPAIIENLIAQVLCLNQAIQGNENFLWTPESPPVLNILFTNSGPRTVDKSSRVRA